MSRRRNIAGEVRVTAVGRRGIGLFEAIASVCLMGLLLTVLLQSLFLLTRHTQRAEVRMAAMDAAGNLLDLAADVPWSELTTADLQRLSAPMDSGWTADWQVVDADADSRRVRVRLRWDDHAAPIELSTWRFVEASPRPASAGDAESSRIGEGAAPR